MQLAQESNRGPGLKAIKRMGDRLDRLHLSKKKSLSFIFLLLVDGRGGHPPFPIALSTKSDFQIPMTR